MGERDSRTLPPVLVIDLRAVLRGDIAAVVGPGRFFFGLSELFWGFGKFFLAQNGFLS